MREALRYGFDADEPPRDFSSNGYTSKLILAVSGGSDSMAMLALAAEIHALGCGLWPLAVTIDHGLRPEAAAEAEQVGQTCKQLGVPHSIIRWERSETGPVSQADARRARHSLLARWAAARGISQIAMAHTRDDRLETFLMRARQGSGWYGLGGLMPYAHSPVWPDGGGLRIFRPLLAFRREELRDHLRTRGIEWIEDPSNQSEKYERVRMRRLVNRMSASTRDKAIHTLDRLAQMRVATAKAAFRLLNDHVHKRGEAADIHLDAREQVGPEAWRRFIEAMVMAAGGGSLPPRGEALTRLLDRIATRDPVLERGVTLAGAKIRLGKGALLTFSRAPPRGERAGSPLATPDWARAGWLLWPTNLGPLRV